VDQAKRVGEAAIEATGKLVAAAARLNKPAEKTVERIETILERPTPPGAGCDQAYDELEADYRSTRKAGARDGGETNLLLLAVLVAVAAPWPPARAR
jgi:hypothetical protein